MCWAVGFELRDLGGGYEGAVTVVPLRAAARVVDAVGGRRRSEIWLWALW